MNWKIIKVRSAILVIAVSILSCIQIPKTIIDSTATQTRNNPTNKLNTLIPSNLPTLQEQPFTLKNITRIIEVGTWETGSVSQLIFSPDSSLIAMISGSPKGVHIYSSQSMNEIFFIDTSASSIAFSPDGHTIVSGSFDKTIRLWDVTSGKQQTLLEGHTAEITCVAFSPDGKTIGSGSYDKTIRLWDIEKGQPTKVLKGDSSEITSLSFSPDGKTLASGFYNGDIILWDVDNGEQIIGFQKWQLNEITSIAYSPNGNLLATGSMDNTIKIWTVGMIDPGKILKGHTDAVWSVAFDPSGQLLASGSWDGTMKLWDVTDSKEVRNIVMGENYINSVAISPNGLMLVNGTSINFGDGGSIHLWRVS